MALSVNLATTLYHIDNLHWFIKNISPFSILIESTPLKRMSDATTRDYQSMWDEMSNPAVVIIYSTRNCVF